MSDTLPLLYLDIEANGLLYDATKIWCIVGYADETYHIYHVDTDWEVCYPNNVNIYKDIDSYLSFLSNYKLVAHNCISYDLPLLAKLHNFKYNISRESIVDTYVLSCLYYPDREGHSIEWWAEQFGKKKVDHEDWSQFSQNMLDRCISDVDILRRVHKSLEDEGKDWDWNLAIDIEYRIADIMSRQEQHGVLFDVPKAEELHKRITSEIKEIEEKVLAEVPKEVIQIGAEVLKPFKKNGSLTKVVEEWVNGAST